MNAKVVAVIVVGAVAELVFLGVLIWHLAGPPRVRFLEDCAAIRERWVSDLILAQRPGCHADSWSAGHYCRHDLPSGERVGTRAY